MTENPCTPSHKIVCTKQAIKLALLVSYWLALAAEETNYFFATLSKQWLSVRHLFQVGVAQIETQQIKVQLPILIRGTSVLKSLLFVNYTFLLVKNN